jgi:cAMP-specific phosphodiesterase 4
MREVVPTGGAHAWKGDNPETSGRKGSKQAQDELDHSRSTISRTSDHGGVTVDIRGRTQRGAIFGGHIEVPPTVHHHRRSQIRFALQRTSWYHSPLAVQIRNGLHGKACACVMVVALLLALFLPDTWTLAAVNSSFASDLILSVVMLLFTVEFFLLCSVDATYLLSFFFLMDIVGTISMIFDISYMVGTDAEEAQIAGDASNKHNLMLLRASRTARVGARAGRLSRVLRVLRFLPFLTNKRAEKSVGISKAISGQLANLLATRVACLTILLVMVIPLFDLMTFPQSDYSLQTWVERLSAQHAAGRLVALEREMRQMVDFYADQNYGPYAAWFGYVEGGKFIQTDSVTNWSPALSAPSRGSHRFLVHTDTFMVGFNFETSTQIEAVLAMVNILFIMFIMVFSGMALSSVVTALAVAPLESMLTTVRQIASTVFKFSAQKESEEEDEDFDIDSSSEMKLLEKVVQKLAIIADLQMGGGPKHITEDMESEDIGILNMMQGKNIVEEKIKQDRRSMAVGANPRKKAALASLTDFGVPQDVVNSFAFNCNELSKAQRITLAVFDVGQFHAAGEGFIQCLEDEQILKRFVCACEAQYLPNPFHNFAHAVDVLHYTVRMMRMVSSEDFLNELEQFSLLIAALGHDLGHPGVNNGFLSEVGHELALQYNDKAPLENMHCAKLYAIVTVSETNVFNALTKDQYREARRYIIESILHTDMMVHQSMVKELQMTWEVNSEVFNKRGDPASSALVQLAEADLFNQGETKILVMETILHSADISNPCRTWECSQAWAWCVLEEFFAQGDQEKMLGVPVQFLNDRDKLNRPNSQIGFLEFMIVPYYAIQIRLWPALSEFGDNLSTNMGNWEEMWVKEVSPDEESRSKVRDRVVKVQESLTEAKSCGYVQPDKKIVTTGSRGSVM